MAPDANTNEVQPLKHDSLFKRMMKDTLVAREFLEEYLPADLQAKLDLSKIKVESESFIEDNLTKRLSDIVYSVAIKNETKEENNASSAKDKAYIYCLIEHQSTDDHFIAFRLFKYALLLAEKHINNGRNKASKKLPLIIPFVLYNGERKHRAPRNLWELFIDPSLAEELLAGDYRLIDLESMPLEEIARKKHIALMEYILKSAREKDLLKVFEKMFKLLPDAIEIDKQQNYLYIKSLIWYIDSKVPEEKQAELKSIVINNLEAEGKEIMRTIADKYIEEGIEKGREEGMAKGIIQVATNMLKQKLDLLLISTATGLSMDQLLKLKASI